MYKQRDGDLESHRPREKELLWSPQVEREKEVDVPIRIEKFHWYAVVDEIAEGAVVMQIASWPELDQGNHLRFHVIYEHTYSQDTLQQVVNDRRAENRQPANDRPLRIGDAFWIESQDRPGANLVDPAFNGNIIDITAAAREQAKVALYGAVARGLSEEEAGKRRHDTQEPNRFTRPDEPQAQARPLDPKSTATSGV